MDVSAHWRSSSTTTTWSVGELLQPANRESRSSNRGCSGSSAAGGEDQAPGSGRPAGTIGPAARRRPRAHGAGNVVEGLHPGPEPRRPLAVPAGPPADRRRAGREPTAWRISDVLPMPASPLTSTSGGRPGRRPGPRRSGAVRPDRPTGPGPVTSHFRRRAGSPEGIWRKGRLSGASRMTPRREGETDEHPADAGPGGTTAVAERPPRHLPGRCGAGHARLPGPGRDPRHRRRPHPPGRRRRCGSGRVLRVVRARLPGLGLAPEAGERCRLVRPVLRPGRGDPGPTSTGCAPRRGRRRVGGPRDHRTDRSGTLYNAVVYLDHTGEVAGLHRKLVPTGAERLVWGNGKVRSSRSWTSTGCGSAR